MNPSMITKIAKAKRYAEEPERIQFTRFEATFRGDNDIHTTNFDNGEWQCTCRFFDLYPNWGECAHTMAMQRVLGVTIPRAYRRGIPSGLGIYPIIHGRPYNIGQESKPSTAKDQTGQILTKSELPTHTLSLFAIAQTKLEEDDRAFVDKVYSVLAGVAQIQPENFEGESFDLTVSDLAEPISFDIILHASENIELSTAWHKTLLYNARDLNPQLIEFTFKTLRLGHSSLDLIFYHDRRWLRTIHFKFDIIELPQPASIPVEE